MNLIEWYFIIGGFFAVSSGVHMLSMVRKEIKEGLAEDTTTVVVGWFLLGMCFGGIGWPFFVSAAIVQTAFRE